MNKLNKREEGVTIYKIMVYSATCTMAAECDRESDRTRPRRVLPGRPRSRGRNRPVLPVNPWGTCELYLYM